MLKIFIGRWKNQTILRTFNAIFMCFLLTALFAAGFVVMFAYAHKLVDDANTLLEGVLVYIFCIICPLVFIMAVSIASGVKDKMLESPYADECLKKVYEPMKMLLGLKADGNNIYSYNRTSFEDNINNIIETAAIKAGLRDVPYVYVLNSFIPTIFSCGFNIKHSAIFVSRKLLEILDEKELEAVILQQIALISSGETNCFYYLSHFAALYMYFARDLFRDGFVDRIDEDNFLDDYLLFALLFKKKGTVLPFFLITSSISLIIPFIMSTFYFFLPKNRMYYADAFSAFVTKDPQTLASALSKIEKAIKQPHFKKNLASLSIENIDPRMFLNDDTLMCKDPLINSVLTVPVMKQMEANYGNRMFQPLKIFPSTKERIDILKSMQAGSFSEYNKMYKRITRKRKGILP